MVLSLSSSVLFQLLSAATCNPPAAWLVTHLLLNLMFLVTTELVVKATENGTKTARKPTHKTEAGSGDIAAGEAENKGRGGDAEVNWGGACTRYEKEPPALPRSYFVSSMGGGRVGGGSG